jgi:hypothetical protein
MIHKSYLAIKVKEFYDFNEYELNPENLKLLVEKIVLMIETHKYKDEKVEMFFNKLNLGEIDNIYRNSNSFLSAFYKFQESKKTKLAM